MFEAILTPGSKFFPFRKDFSEVGMCAEMQTGSKNAVSIA